MRRLGPLLFLTAMSACSLIVQFDPESQPCDASGGCADGFSCVDKLCKRLDGGVVLDGGSTTPAHETNCADGLDEDLDGRKDCADDDCAAKACSDGNGCTTGETCTAGTCMGGTTMLCNTPGPCQSGNGLCVPAMGRCVYPALADGASCGFPLSSRCCAGACLNINENTAHCGGCGLACATGQVCQSINQSTCALDPTELSGRCSCGTGAPCPSGQMCTAGFCVPTAQAQCAPGEMVANSGGACVGYCRY